MNQHEKWLSRRIYHEVFSTPVTTFLMWRGVPNRCQCGCGEIWYDRVSPVNWWQYISPQLIFGVQFLFPVFRAFHSLLWSLPPAVWALFQVFRSTYKDNILNKIGPGEAANAMLAIAFGRTLVYGVIAPLVISLWIATWVLTRIGGILVLAMHLMALSILTALMGILLVVSIIAISMRGLVFVIGGVASVTYSYYPAVGIALIIVGVLLEYERNRRNDRNREERLGYLLSKIQGNTHDAS